MDHVQQHTGQHLLSAMFLKELGAKTVSFHLGADSVTIDLAIEKVSEEELRRVEAAVNRVIYEDRAMRPTWVERAEAEAMLDGESCGSCRSVWGRCGLWRWRGWSSMPAAGRMCGLRERLAGCW